MEELTSPGGRGRNFGKGFWPLYGLALLGFLGYVPTIISSAARVIAGMRYPHPGQWIVYCIPLLGIPIVFGIMVAIGCATAPRMGLRSHLIERFTRGTPFLPAIRDEAPLALKIGLITSVIAAMTNLVFRLLQGDHPLANNSITSLDKLFDRMNVLVYYGIDEEFVYRWCIMSLLGWMIWKWVGWPWAQNEDGTPRNGMMWIVILLSALLLGALRLHPAVNPLPLTPLRVARLLIVNGILGIGPGWLFWTRSLEVGMMAHLACGLMGLIRRS